MVPGDLHQEVHVTMNEMALDMDGVDLRVGCRNYV